MYKPQVLQRGDRVAIVSLSSGLLGETFVRHSLALGTKRLHELGLNPVFMPNSLKGMDYLAKHPEARADDLKAAFEDSKIRAIICAIGGDDGYLLAPYLLDDKRFATMVRENPKLFTGFSDATSHHLMLYQLGLSTLYGHTFLTDFAELGDQMLPETKRAVERWFCAEQEDDIVQSALWYEERHSHGIEALGQNRVAHPHLGYRRVQGVGQVCGAALGGCLEVLVDLLTGAGRVMNERYQLVPPAEHWRDKVLMLETSELQPTPSQFYEMLLVLKRHGMLQYCAAVGLSQPQNGVFYHEYQSALVQVLARQEVVVVDNLPFGHSYPRDFWAYGQELAFLADGSIKRFGGCLVPRPRS